MKLGFVGLGQMGFGMAANLIKAGHELSVYNRTAEKAAKLVALGARLSPTPADAARGAEAVVTMVADDKALEAVVFGPSGFLSTLPHGAVHVSASTISVAIAEKLTEAHHSASQYFVAAPVFGRPDAAAAAKLYVAAAGAPEALARVQPIFAAIGQRTFLLSDQPSAANLVKLSGNFLIASVIESLGEAVALVAKGGIEPEAYIELLTSTLFGAPVYKTYGGLIAEQKFSPPGFAAILGQKDVRLVLEAAETLNVPLPLASLLRDRFLALLAQPGGAALDWSAISTLARRDSGQ